MASQLEEIENNNFPQYCQQETSHSNEQATSYKNILQFQRQETPCPYDNAVQYQRHTVLGSNNQQEEIVLSNSKYHILFAFHKYVLHNAILLFSEPINVLKQPNLCNNLLRLRNDIRNSVGINFDSPES
jgi:hypothetical protein